MTFEFKPDTRPSDEQIAELHLFIDDIIAQRKKGFFSVGIENTVMSMSQLGVSTFEKMDGISYFECKQETVAAVLIEQCRAANIAPSILLKEIQKAYSL